MALTRDKMLEAIAAGKAVPFYKPSVANMGTGYIASTWRTAGGMEWIQGAIPSTAAIPDDTLAGGIALPSFTGKTGRIYGFRPVGTTVGVYMVYDRIAHMGGLSGTSVASQTVDLSVATPLAAGRCQTNYRDIEWMVEIYTDIGTTAANLTVTYTDSADTGSKTIVITGFSGASPLTRSGRCVYLLPTDGIPIKSIQSAQLNTSTLTAGNFGITARVRKVAIGQMLAYIQSPGTDAISIGMPEIKDSACLELLVQCSTTSTGVIQGQLNYGMVAE